MNDEQDSPASRKSTEPDLPLADVARIYIWDIRDIDRPVLADIFEFRGSLDHNLFIKKDLVYQARFDGGVRVLKIARTEDEFKLYEVAHMDTEPRRIGRSTNKFFDINIGTISVYPFFDSGTITVSDGLNGLILMRLALP